MPPTRKGRIPNEVLEHIYLLFFNVIGKQRKKNTFYDVLSVVISDNERLTIAKRIAVFYLYLKDFNQPHIAKILNLSQSTVSKFTTKIATSNVIVLKRFEKILLSEKISRAFDDLIDDLFLKPGRLKSDWKLGWEKKFYKQRKDARGI